MSAPLPQSAFADVMQRSLRVGLLSPHNPHDRTAFSGTVHHAVRALSSLRGVEVAVLGGHGPLPWHHRLSRRMGRPAAAIRGGDLADVDIVVGLVASGLMADAAALTRAPLVHVTDATPAFLREVYGLDVPHEADMVEARVLAASRRVVYSSDYMAERAVAEFGRALRPHVTSIPFGTNLDGLPSAMPPKSFPSPLNLLWVGSEWARKGGEIALAAVDILRAGGRDARLTLVGDVPAGIVRRRGVEVVGYLDKNRRRDAARLRELYRDAHLFVLPTRADCTPMVLAEAGAHGTPVLVTDTGGVGSLVSEGANGRLLPAGAAPPDWARAIRAMTDDPERHAALCRSSFDHARTRLTWDAWALRMSVLLRAEVASAESRRAA